MVTVKQFFITQGLKYMELNDYLKSRLVRAGYVDVQVFRTPIGTRVVIYAERPALVIGRRGATIRELAQTLQTKFGFENPQIDVIEIQNPELNPKIMAYRIARALARGVKFRRAAFIALHNIMEAGARGAEIVISGKLTSERHRFEKFRDGVVIKSGKPGEELVNEATVQVLLKPGIYGVKVKIMPPVELPHKIKIKQPEVVT